jgi:hypothetical protein
MSLNVYLRVGEERIEDCPHCEGSGKVNHGREEVFSTNITHNLNKMADAAGIYQACWRPEEIGVTKAGQLVPLLREGLRRLQADPTHFRKFNAENGWGTYEHFVPWVRQYLSACEDNPDADVSVSR